MRISARKVSKYCTFLIAICLVNIWISYNVNIWSFSNLNDRGKVRPTFQRRAGADVSSLNNGNNADGRTVSQSHTINNSVKDSSRGRLMELFRPQRSAKSVINGDNNDIITLKNEQFNLIGQSINSNNRTLVDREEGLKFKTSRDKLGNHGSINTQRGKSHPFELKRKTDLSDIFISVKTTNRYHKSRVDLILKTWYLLAKDEIHFFTDAEDNNLKEILGDHIVNTNCSADHGRQSLSCKMSVEFDYYMASRKRWFCHMDDDIYLNTPQLLALLQSYDHREDWYLGKPSLGHPLEIQDRENPGMKLAFWFATGGAGFCISRSLALKMAPHASGGRFMTTSEQIRLPDDCTIGYIVEHLLRQQLTVVSQFHSHLEALKVIKPAQLMSQITLSFSFDTVRPNVVSGIPGFPVSEDPTRFRSIHCFLFPTFKECRHIL